MNEALDWRLYERFVASLYSSEASDTLTVVPNARLWGVSGTKRQVDLLIDARIEHDVSRRIIVDAKRRKGRIDVNDVEAFEGMMRDCRAHRGIIVCSSGFTEGAKRRAQEHIGLILVPLQELEQLDLMSWESCLGTCASSTSKRRKKGLVLYHQAFGLVINDSPLSELVVGKCDGCGNFHIWCWRCGSKFALADEAEHHCGCDWFWLTAIEEEEQDDAGVSINSVLLLLILMKPALAIIPLDRRPLG